MRMRKAWIWIGAFGPDLMLCEANARVGVARTAWWAVWDGTRLHEKTFHRTGPVDVTPERIRIGGVMDLVVESAVPWAARTGDTWTRKRPARVRGTVRGRPVDLPGLVDESAGRHARRLEWWWSAGAGELRDGRAVTWNLVDGLHDGVDRSTQPTAAAGTSERAVWVDGVPAPVPPQPFHGLAGVGDLRFTAVATRARKENLLLIASDYEQPFGRFAGSLPVAGPLRAGWGVMERHRVRW
jgi:Protein of unknown function (DUF2804)